MKIKFIIAILFVLSLNAFSQQFPSEIKGNWLNAADSIEWLYSFQPKFAVFDTKFWEYKSITKKGNEYNLHLLNEKKEKHLSVKVIDNNTLIITSKDETPIQCTNRKAIKPDFRNYDTIEFKEPILVDDTATIYGFIEDYDTIVFSKVGQISYYSVQSVSDKNSDTDFEIQPDGRFMARFRMFNPQNVWLNIDGSTQTTFFAKPGETHMVCFNKLLSELTLDERKWNDISDWQVNHYMGKFGLLSEELILLEKYYNYGVEPIQQRITNHESMHQLKYESWRLQTYENELRGLDSIANLMRCSAKARQVMSTTAKFSVLEDLLSLPFKNPACSQFSQKYIDRLPTINTSSDLNILTANYMYYINYLGFFYRTQVLGGHYLDNCKSIMDYYANYVTDTIDLQRMTEWNNFYSTYSWPNLMDRNDPVDRENDSLLTRQNYNYYNIMVKITTKYNQVWEKLYKNQMIKEFDFVMNKYNNDLTGQMYAIYHILLLKHSVDLDPTIIEWAKLRITNPILLNYLLESKKAKEELKLKYSTYANGTHIIDSIACDKNSDAFFTAILKKFEGKVVYIDFWADWCSPCRAEFEPAAKLKQEYAGKDIVFLYLGISCKKNLWEDMIKEKQLEGYHYWLNRDQGAVMYKKFNFKGIPHFLLVDKTGKILEGVAPRPSSKVDIRERLDALLK